MLLITLKKSPIGNKPIAKKTLIAMGLTRIGKTVKMKDIPATKGMILRVAHLLSIVNSPDS
ncbi:MAG: 50S ribosomal protein L30 [Nitrospirae bacterium]|nr:50S ribosomal protein L30 [Nitrospirota bacterium]MBF0541522.1 50S ribosomal protein L30 [Nitrospirota bacterium]